MPPGVRLSARFYRSTHIACLRWGLADGKLSLGLIKKLQFLARLVILLTAPEDKPMLRGDCETNLAALLIAVAAWL